MPSNLTLSQGKPYPFGATINEEGTNFSIHIENATEVILSLFNENETKAPFEEISLNPKTNKTGTVWHILVKNLPPFILYNYKILPKTENATFLTLSDPYAKGIYSHHRWGDRASGPYFPFGKILPASNFDWEGDQFPNIPKKELLIYEMHIRGFTQDPSSKTQSPGTFLGLIEKIPYLKDLGINAVELLPIYEFNETETQQINPFTHEPLCNYFGYSTVNFFAPMNRYIHQPQANGAIDEFKMMVKALHKNGIEVILDVVYNHTFEGGIEGLTQSYKGLNPKGYYMINGEGNYLNFSGCGNTFNSNHPIVKELIINSLRYWVTEMHVDGFRFDLASILSRGEDGTPLPQAPIIEAISKDPILSQTKLIAEAWDAAGLYQVGGFYPGPQWSEWNGRYRDVVRRFIKGTPGNKTAFATALCGSQDLYGWRGSPTCSVNFVTAHDGFSLQDLVSYNTKHNEANGEKNRDGFDHNESWNCGVEGATTNKKVIQLRQQQMKNFHLALLVSQGIPMLLMGDEYAHTRKGNNNTWCQDNPLNWFLWNEIQSHPAFFRFYRALIQFRKTHPSLGRTTFLNENEISWHGTTPLQPEWEKDNGIVAFSLNGENQTPILYVAFNASNISVELTLPPIKEEKKWLWVVNTSQIPPDDFYDEGNRPAVSAPSYKIAPYSAIMLESV